MTGYELHFIFGFVVVVIIYTTAYIFGWKAGKDRIDAEWYEKGYRRCLYVWHKEILFWKDGRVKRLLSSTDKAYHEDIVTITREFEDRGVIPDDKD